MSQHVQRRANGSTIEPRRVPAVARWMLPIVIVFAIAFTADMATGQRYSSVWGSLAILASIVAVFPAVRPALGALGGYGAVWVAFNLARAVFDDLQLALSGQGSVSGWERSVFGGRLPSAWLQERLSDDHQPQPHDIALSIIHGSFFVVPFAVAALLWFRWRCLFPRYLAATAITFAIGLVGFLLLPTAPPWMAAPEEVSRVTHHLLSSSGLVAPGGSGFAFEPNPLAAMPSIHVAATVLVFLVARRIGPMAAVIAGIYALLMGVAVVYLGEHYVLDAVMGWIVALLGWAVVSSRRTGAGPCLSVGTEVGHHRGVIHRRRHQRRWKGDHDPGAAVRRILDPHRPTM